MIKYTFFDNKTATTFTTSIQNCTRSINLELLIMITLKKCYKYSNCAKIFNKLVHLFYFIVFNETKSLK